jgi:hypothetical protein
VNFLEELGIVKTARREAESVLLLKALIQQQTLRPLDKNRFLKLAEKNKVLLRAAPLLDAPDGVVKKAKMEADEAMRLYDLMSDEFEQIGVPFVVIKSFDSLPDIGHDLDFLLPDSSEFRKAEKLLLGKMKVRPQPLTHCDKLVGKFSCFLPGFDHDFELYPTISQLGEEHVEPSNILKGRKIERIEGKSVWVTSDKDRVLIRIIHAMFRHNFLKLSDIIDFESLMRNCTTQEILDEAQKADIGDAFLFFIQSIDRFLTACDASDPKMNELKTEGEKRFGKDRLGVFRRDRLVLPYRIPTMALIMIFLLKGVREASRGRWRSALKCIVSPPLLLLDFVNAVFGFKLLGGRLW